MELRRVLFKIDNDEAYEEGLFLQWGIRWKRIDYRSWKNNGKIAIVSCTMAFVQKKDGGVVAVEHYNLKFDPPIEL